ncbi:MAG: glycosyltransferase family 4 protein [Planctomycetes bacterium]|nr:glycosyltransferase family 4 protein [Planctomycetota bacterium]
MKVLLYNTRPDSLQDWGGDTTQLQQTQRAMEALGVQVVYGREHPPDLAGYDLVHLFNLQLAQNGVELATRAKEKGLPVALSTIWWDLSYIDRSPESHPFRRYGPVSRLLMRISPTAAFSYRQLRRQLNKSGRRRRRAQRRLLEMADVVLPNSHAELEILVQQFQMPNLRAKAFVVPNGVTVLPQDGCTLRDHWPQLPHRYVLEAARCHHLKGQARVIRALRDEKEIPIVLAGDDFETTKYGRWCKQLGQARGNVFFLGAVPHERMPLLYRHAGVHVLPSLRESPGLASLEAAVHGANCVISIHCPVEEYFGKDAFVCDPDDLGSVRRAILQAWTHPPTAALRSRILSSFTWTRAALRTYEAYQWIVQGVHAR